MYLNSLITTAIAEKRQRLSILQSARRSKRAGKLFSQAGHPSRALTNEDKKAC